MPKTTKKETKKAAAKQEAPTMKKETQVNRYELVSALPKKVKSAQQLLIAKALAKLGPATTADIASAIKKDLVTVQPAERVVSYYLQVWGRKGLVKAIE